MLDTILENIKAHQDPEQAAIHKAYHKSDLHFNGLKVPQMRKIASQSLKLIKDEKQFFDLFYALWKIPDFETRSIAVFMLMKRIKWLHTEHFSMFYPLFRDCDGWALTDYLGIHVLGEFLRKYPPFDDDVDGWKTDNHIWVRRAGILRFITRAKHADPWPLRMEPILVHHLPEKNFFIRKAIGWNLREWGKKEKDLVARFIRKYRDDFSPLTYREATKHISDI